MTEELSMKVTLANEHIFDNENNFEVIGYDMMLD